MSLPKKILYGKEARAALKAGVDKNANAVKVTLGAGGRFVVIGNYMREAFSTQDGVTVSRNIVLPDPFEERGNQMVRHAADSTMRQAGDGTTTATILAQYLIAEGIKEIEAGKSPMVLKAEIEAGSKEVVAQIKKQARPINVTNAKEIMQVALVAAKGDEEIAKLVTEAVIATGENGIIAIGEANSYKSEVKTANGARLPKGYGKWRHFINNAAKATCEFENPYILLSEKRITAVKDILPILEKVFADGSSLLIICEEADGEALGTMVANKNRGLKVCYIPIPGIGSERIEWLQDISALTGTPIYGPNHNHSIKLPDLKLSDLGRAKRTIVSDQSSIIVGKDELAERMKERVEVVKAQIEEADDEQKQPLKNRLALISGGIATINIGGATDIEVKERKDRVDDAVRATQSALAEGIVAGGGVCLMNCNCVSSEIINNSLFVPSEQILTNAGNATIIDSVKNDYGVNVRTGETGNMFDMGIIDSAKVVRCAWENACSVAIQVIMCECILCEEEPKIY